MSISVVNDPQLPVEVYDLLFSANKTASTMKSILTSRIASQAPSVVSRIPQSTSISVSFSSPLSVFSTSPVSQRLPLSLRLAKMFSSQNLQTKSSPAATTTVFTCTYFYF
uniref:Ovule protein n=1 Tax=Panagrellus redivivus TaxID=6233 RepID=A0A7E4UZW0_PANRE